MSYKFVPTKEYPFPWSPRTEGFVAEHDRHWREESGNPPSHFFDPSFEFQKYEKRDITFDGLKDKMLEAFLWQHNFTNDNHRWWVSTCNNLHQEIATSQQERRTMEENTEKEKRTMEENHEKEKRNMEENHEKEKRTMEENHEKEKRNMKEHLLTTILNY
jgi:hypothetical protein